MSITKLRPLDDRVLIKQKDADKVSEGGVIIPDSAQQKPAEGIVVAVGPGIVKMENIQLKAIYKLLKWAISFWVFRILRQGADDMPEEDVTSNPMTVKVGDYVTFGRYAGTKIEYDKEEYMMVRQADVFMVDDEKTEELKKS